MPGINDNGEAQAESNLTNNSHTLANSAARPNLSLEDNHQIWQIVLRDLYSQLDRHEYDSWIKNLALLDITYDTALVAAPTTYARRRLESDYADLVSRTLSGVVGHELAVQFTVETPVQANLFESAQTSSGSSFTTAPITTEQRATTGPGIKSRGPYLNLDSNGNGSKNRAVSGRSAGFGNGINGRPASYGIRARKTYDVNPDLVTPYVVPEEIPDVIDDPITNPPGVPNQDGQNTNDPVTVKFGLNPRYVFDKYIVGNSNRMAYAASVSVSENPGNSYNPLFIYGGVGLGKTHLLHAIGHQGLRLRPYLKVLYVSSEKFTNDLINAIREQTMEEFRARYRSIDILMIDDIQFIADKERTQEEFFHTFNTLVESNKQVVISSDRPPKSMLVLSDRLRSRFEGGLITDISMPDYETRLAILRAKADYQPTHIPSEVMDFIAHKVPSNIRELEGALIRVVAFGYLNKMPITVELAAQALNDSLMNSRKKLVTKERILEAVANFFNVELKELQGRSRSADIVLPRQIAMYLVREHTDHSLVEIGQALGGRDHTTVMHGLEKIEQAFETNSQLRQQINTITQIVYNGDNVK